MKLTCNTQYKILTGILDVGDKIELEIIRTEVDKIIQKREYYSTTDSKGYAVKGSRMVTDFIIPKGSYVGYRFKAKDGKVYSDHSIHCAIGYKSLGDIFAKPKSQN